MLSFIENLFLPTRNHKPLLAQYSQPTPTIAPKRFLRITLGVLWIIAGLLQAQPDMFTTDFYANYPSKVMESLLQSVADGQPKWLDALVHFGMFVWAEHPIFYNIGAILVQIGIGSILLFGPAKGWSKFGLWTSIVWGTGVWVFGEGMGGLFSGATFFDGWPGAVILYVLGAAMLLAPDRLWHEHHIERVLRWFLVVFWFVMAGVQALPSSGFWQSGGLMNQFANSASLPQPGILSAPIQSFSYATLHHPILWNTVFIGVMCILALGYLVSPRSRWLTIFAGIWLFWSWWFGQDFGTVFSGLGTDVNSAPLLMMFTIAHRMMARHVGHGTLTSSS